MEGRRGRCSRSVTDAIVIIIIIIIKRIAKGACDGAAKARKKSSVQ
jgi:hypothetical protein